jgi:hypothetical protein
MKNQDYKGQTVVAASKRAKVSLAKIGIRYYDLGNFTKKAGKKVESVGKKERLVGVPTLITARDASFKAGKIKVRASERVPREQSGQRLSKALLQQGFDENILTLLNQVIDMRVAQQVGLLVDAAQRAEQEPRQEHIPRVDPSLMLTAAEFGTRLGGLSDETVRQREKSGQLFSVLPEGRHRGREYPAFQLLPGIAGESLQALLRVLGDLGGALIYQFMTSPNDALDGLSPLQLLIKEPDGDEAATSLLALPNAQRLDAVLNCAVDFHSEMTA